jgi:hypothetical protein
MFTIQKWLPSGRAAEELGLSKTTLRRYADAGVLAEGVHYRRGLTDKSPFRWDVVAVVKALEKNRVLPARPVAASLEEGPTDD